MCLVHKEIQSSKIKDQEVTFIGTKQEIQDISSILTLLGDNVGPVVGSEVGLVVGF